MSLIISTNPLDFFDQYGLVWADDEVMTEREWMDRHLKDERAMVIAANSNHDRLHPAPPPPMKREANCEEWSDGVFVFRSGLS